MIRALGTLAGLLLILALTLAIFGLPVGHSLALMASGAFGDKLAITRTLVKTIPLTIAGMGIVVAWRAGMYNIGGEGQFIVGGLAACLAAIPLRDSAVPGGIGVVLMLAASVVGGAMWGGIAGWLRNRRGVDVVISTILLNFVAIQLLAWLVAGPLRDVTSGLPLTPELPDRMMLPRFDRQTDLHAGIFVAILAVAAIHVFLFLTKAGFQTRLVGESESAARANRIDADRVKSNAMLISGALCGLAGGVEYAGIAGQLGTSFAQGWGFLAIPVALLGGLHPIWVFLSALYFGALFAGSRNLAGFTDQGTTLIYVIQAAAVLGLIAIRAVGRRRRVRMEAA
ncbi:MAG TPA: ABC transporter permease [Fimbriimonadaceae bacterium]|nr:ABC transporter permease [Fimbriimonadaceae bacterium]